MAKKKTATVKTEEWVWVEGYKGTDKDMKCRDYQYELGKQFDMPEGSDIRLCDSGFHFCKELEDVFKHYDVEDGNRFFKVKALVRKDEPEDGSCGFFNWNMDTKETSKSIEFISELTTDEILAAKRDAKDFNDEEKALARTIGVHRVINARKIGELLKLGYAYDVAKYIVEALKKYDEAYVLAQQTDISMDTRIMVLFNGAPKPSASIWQRINIPKISPLSYKG